MTRSLGDELLASRPGVAFLAAGEASGRLEEALRLPGVTLCLAAHAIREVVRGTDGGRIDELRDAPPSWVREAAASVDARTDLAWWSRPAIGAVHRQVADGLTGVEVVDHQGRARSLAEEGDAHLHTFTRPAHAGSMRRWRPDLTVEVAMVDGPQDWEALNRRPSRTLPGTHLTLRGALTIDRETDDRHWPWDVAGVWWTEPVPGTPLPEDERGTWRHDHAWVPIGRPYDPRFDEGDEIDGSDLRS